MAFTKPADRKSGLQEGLRGFWQGYFIVFLTLSVQFNPAAKRDLMLYIALDKKYEEIVLFD